MADPKDTGAGGGLVIDIKARRPDQTFAPDITRDGQLGGGRERSDDAGVDYMVERQRLDASTIEQRAREKYGVPLPAQGDQPGASPVQAASLSPSPGEAPGGGEITDPATGMPPQGTVPEKIAKMGIGEAAGAVGREIVGAPAAVGAGVGAAGTELFKAADSMASWLNANVVDLTLPIPKTGSTNLDALLANPAQALARTIDAITPSAGKSATAPIIKEVAQFLTAMATGGKLFKGIGAFAEGVGGASGAAIKSLATGAVGDALMFDPNEENLAAFLNKVPALEKVVPDFLATDPNDNEAVNRLRRAVEGLGLGVATEGLMAAFRAYRAARAGNAGEKIDPAKAAMAEQEAKYGKMSAEDLAKVMGGDSSPNAKLVSFVDGDRAPSPKSLSEAADDKGLQAEVKAEPKPAAGDLADGRIAINWARIDTADDVKVVIRDMTDRFQKEIKKARRGKITQEETAKLADELGMTVDDLIARREGQAFNAEEILAARQLLTAATERTLATARIASGPNAGPMELFAYRRAVATEAAVLREVLAARAEAGRALNAWKIPAAASGDVERSRAIIDALEAAGGDQTTREIARRHALLMDSGAPPSALHEMAMASSQATKWQMVSEVWVNGLLSSPKTHLVNAASNTLVMAQTIIERGVAEKLSALGRAEGALPSGVAPGEAAAMMAGIIAAQKDAWRMFWIALRTGETGSALGKVDLPRTGAISAESFRLQDNGLARMVDFLGTAERMPSRLLGASDELFKTIGYRMEVNAQAVRQATSEGLDGVALRERVAELVKNPPENIRLEAVDAAAYMTFTQNAGSAASALVRIREKWPATVFVLPFIKTPINIVRYGFERTPIAPFMSGVRDDIAAGGVRRELALARMGTGTSIMLMAADYADRGLITGKGPKDPGQREALQRQGWQPYSVRVGDKWVAYERADPYGMLMGFAADMADINRRMEVDGDKLDEFSELWAAGIAAVASTVVNKTYLKGIADFMWMIEDSDRRAFGYLGGQVGSLVPSGVNFAKSVGDPVMRERMKIWDYIQARIPVYAEGLTPARDLWGKPREQESGYGPEADAINPWRVQKLVPSPIDAEMQRLRLGVERIDRKSMVEGVPTNFRDFPQVYDRYVVLAGNALKHPAWGLGARDYLDAVVEGRHPMSAVYSKMSDGPEGGKADFITATVRDYRKLAQAAILADRNFGEFKIAWRQQQAALDDKQGTFGGVERPARPDVPRIAPAGTATPQTPPASLSPMRVP